MVTCSVVHLVRKANDPALFARFALNPYVPRTVDGRELVLACKGFDDADMVWPTETPRQLRLPDVGWDLGTYHRAAKLLDSDALVFLNSYSRPLVADWLDKLLSAMEYPTVGLAGCTGSHEGVHDAPYPNPHIRTNAFCIRRSLFLSLDLTEPQTKWESVLQELGPNSITKQVKARGLDAVVVNSEGELWPIDRARNSATFRWGDQRRLLMADNRTDHFQHAMSDERAHLQRLAWGCVE